MSFRLGEHYDISLYYGLGKSKANYFVGALLASLKSRDHILDPGRMSPSSMAQPYITRPRLLCNPAPG